MAGRVLCLCLRLSTQQSLGRRRELSPVSTVLMTNRLKSIAVAVCATAWLFLTGANATTVIPPTFEEMTDRADLVFVGKLACSREELRSIGTNCVLFTLVDFETNEVLKWNGDRSVRLPSAIARDILGITKLV